MQKHKILIIEDEPDILFLLQQRASKNNFHCELEQTGLQAAERAENDQPDIILLDLQLPAIHGFEILKQLKANSKTKKIPVVILTSSKEKEDAQKAISLGASAYFTKTEGFDKLFMMIKDYIK